MSAVAFSEVPLGAEFFDPFSESRWKKTASDAAADLEDGGEGFFGPEDVVTMVETEPH